jgi:hypothetical protein
MPGCPSPQHRPSRRRGKTSTSARDPRRRDGAQVGRLPTPGVVERVHSDEHVAWARVSPPHASANDRTIVFRAGHIRRGGDRGIPDVAFRGRRLRLGAKSGRWFRASTAGTDSGTPAGAAVLAQVRPNTITGWLARGGPKRKPFPPVRRAPPRPDHLAADSRRPRSRPDAPLASQPLNLLDHHTGRPDAAAKRQPLKITWQG